MRYGPQVKRRYTILIGLILSALAAPSAYAVHQSGSTTELVGFSADDARMMIRSVDVQRGVQRFVIVGLGGSSPRTVHPVRMQDDPKVLEAALRRTYQIHSLGFVGGLSPSGHAAVIVQPDHPSTPEVLRYRIQWYDGEGVRSVDDVVGVQRCAVADDEGLRFRVTWSPLGTVAVVTGGVARTETCESPAIQPILVVGRSKSTETSRNGWVTALSRTLAKRTRRLEARRHGDALHCAEQWLSIAPAQVKPLVFVARLRARSGDMHGALRALWVLRALPDNSGLAPLRREMRRSWSEPLRSFASFRALQWELSGAGRPANTP
jgi:hypothetical protein